MIVVVVALLIATVDTIDTRSRFILVSEPHCVSALRCRQLGCMPGALHVGWDLAACHQDALLILWSMLRVFPCVCLLFIDARRRLL